jgi:hypothetical protein
VNADLDPSLQPPTQLEVVARPRCAETSQLPIHCISIHYATKSTNDGCFIVRDRAFDVNDETLDIAMFQAGLA